MAPSSSSSSPKAAKKPSRGRQKIEIKKVEQTNKRYVTFSKRKLGLFRKAAELSLLCDSEIAVIVFSQHGKVFSSGHPDPDSVIRRYLSGCGSSSSSDPPPVVHDQKTESMMSSLRLEYEKAMKVLEEEKKSLEDAMAETRGSGFGWWNRPIEDMGLEDVVQFKECVEQLRQNLVAAAEKKASLINSPPALPPPVAATEFSYLSLLNGDMFETDQTWDSLINGDGSDSSCMLYDSLDHYY